MTKMYAVGNDLARLRIALDRAPADHPAPSAPPTPAPSPATPAPGAPVPPAWRPPTSELQQPPVGPVPPAQPATWPPLPPSPAAPPAAPLPPREPWWQREGMIARVLASVGAAITLIGLAFLLAMAIQYGYFGPAARVISGGILSVAMIGAGFFAKRRGLNDAGAVGLVATGFAAAYLDIMAVTRIYEWVPAIGGLVLAGLVAIGGLVIARMWRSEMLGVITALGVGLLGPAIGGGQVAVVGGFLLIMAAATALAPGSDRWSFLDLARVLPPAIYFSSQAANAPQTVSLLAITLVAGICGLAILGLRDSRVGETLAWGIPIATLAAVAGGLATERWYGTAVLVVLSALLLLTAVAAPPRADLPAGYRVREVAIATAGATTLVAVVHATDSAQAPLVLLIAALAWVVTAILLRDRVVALTGTALSALAILLAFRLIPMLLARPLADRITLTHLGETVLVVALLATLGVLAYRLLPETIARTWGRVLVAGAVVCTAGVAIVAGALIGGVIADPRSGFTAGHAAATIIWAGIATYLLIHGLRRTADASLAVRAGLVLVVVVVAKLFLFDLATLSGFARVLAFVLAGILLLAMGTGYGRALDRSRRESAGHGAPAPPAAAPPR